MRGLKDSRPSHPPGAESLRHAEERQRLANDRLEATLSPVELTDAQRLECVREIRGFMVRGYGNCFEDLSAYEASVRGRVKR